MIIGKGIYLTIRRPDWFVTGKIDSDVLSKNDVDGHNTKSVLANGQNDILIDSNNEEYMTDINVRPLIKSRNDISDCLNGITYDSLFSGAESRILINQNIDGKAHIMRLGKVDTDISIGENAETLKTENPLFTESINDIVTGSNANTFKTSAIKRDSVAAGLFIGNDAQTKNYPSFLRATTKSGAVILQNAEGYVEAPTIIKAGTYEGRTGITTIARMNITLNFMFQVNGTVYYGKRITQSTGGGQLYWHDSNGNLDIFAIVHSEGDYYSVDLGAIHNFTVTEDTEVDEIQFSRFNNYFELI